MPFEADPLVTESNQNAPLRLLSLDGGGVRGLSALMVLEDLMENIAAEERRIKKRKATDSRPIKPCDYFDLIGGTSTGGIIAILLGRLRLDVRRCIEIYTELAQEIFQKDRSVHMCGVKVPMSAHRFSGATLERAIRNALDKLGFDEDELMWDDSLFEEINDPNIDGDNIWADAIPITDSPTSLRSLKSTLKDGTAGGSKDGTASVESSIILGDAKQSPQISRTSTVYETPQGSIHIDGKKHTKKQTWRIRRASSVHQKKNQKGCRVFVVTTLKNALGLPRLLETYNPNDRTTQIWEALRATSAAPTFFEEMSFGVPKMTYLDGGVGFNNPCAEVDYAAKAIWEGRPIGVIVSIGTGLQTVPSVRKIASWLPFGLGTDIALASALASMATGTARVDNEMARMYHETETKYYRFDVDAGLSNVSLDQWMKEDEIGALTEQYMRDPPQLIRARELGRELVKLSALPPAFAISPIKFNVGVLGKGIVDGSFKQDDLDHKTGFPLGVTVSPEDMARRHELRTSSPSGEGGVAVDPSTGKMRRIFPVALDLDGDGRREESSIFTCLRADNVCLRTLRTGIPAGLYRVKFIACFFESPEGCVPPTEVIFSVGKPFDPNVFSQRYVDVRITPDVVPVLLHTDAVRVRVGRKRWAEVKGKGWIEIEGDVEVRVGLDGNLGFVVNKIFKDGQFVGGWAFGGVRLEPVFSKH